MTKRAIFSSVLICLALGCSEEPSSTGGMTASGAGGVAAAGSGTGPAGSSAAGSSAAGSSAAGSSAAGRAAAAGSGGAGASAAGAPAAGSGGMPAAGSGGATAAGAPATAGGGSGASGSMAGGSGGMPAAGSGGGAFALTSSVVENGKMLPVKYRCPSMGGMGPNPPLAWSGAPAGTMSYAILLRDRTFMNYQHWTIYDIPAATTSLPEGVPMGATTMPMGAKQASNSGGLAGPGYVGPCGRSVNMYEFVLYALSVPALPMAGMTGASVEMALEMHDLAKASLTVMSGPP